MMRSRSSGHKHAMGWQKVDRVNFCSLCRQAQTPRDQDTQGRGSDGITAGRQTALRTGATGHGGQQCYRAWMTQGFKMSSTAVLSRTPHALLKHRNGRAEMLALWDH